jgi:hypothetical protein
MGLILNLHLYWRNPGSFEALRRTINAKILE